MLFGTAEDFLKKSVSLGVYVVAPTPASAKPKALSRTLMTRVVDDVTVSEIVQVIPAVSRKDLSVTRLQAAFYDCAAVHAAALGRSRLARSKVGVMGCKPQTVSHLAEPSPQAWAPRGVYSSSVNFTVALLWFWRGYTAALLAIIGLPVGHRCP